MDVGTTDQRAWSLAPHLVVVRATGDAAEWLSPDSGTTCRLEAVGEYVVLRRVGTRVTPVVAGTVLPDEAAVLLTDPDAVSARRAAAHAIVAVDAGVRD
ncbi:hypothetical protein G5V58_03285 [Nocardioides anomalus]|uniref:Uncharacterized protein n=1 Tax=Nocardioides anomalus TaxID=2712223 RepID=A0A6G6W9N4_9ACTN|nr:hypothetical protein [Nocardioides anomalus]QIG41932.1 hypothetical protein G5V58_03285 [Nocardioides anomalus]